MVCFACFGVVLLVDNTEKPRRPAKSGSEQKPTGSRSNAPSAGRRDGPRPAAHSTSSDGQRRPQGQSSGPRPQGSFNRGPRPQGQSSGPRPQGAGERPAPVRSAPKAPFTKKAPEEEEGLGLPETDESTDLKSARLPKKNDASNYSMSYRGSSQRVAGRNGSSPNKQNKKNNAGGKPAKAASQRQSMLNTHKLAPFKYDMNEILSQSSMDPTMASSFLASVIAKASRISTKDAKDYARTFVDAGNLTKDEFDKISKLMDRYSKYR